MHYFQCKYSLLLLIQIDTNDNIWLGKKNHSSQLFGIKWSAKFNWNPLVVHIFECVNSRNGCGPRRKKKSNHRPNLICSELFYEEVYKKFSQSHWDEAERRENTSNTADNQICLFDFFPRFFLAHSMVLCWPYYLGATLVPHEFCDCSSEMNSEKAECKKNRSDEMPPSHIKAIYAVVKTNRI